MTYTRSLTAIALASFGILAGCAQKPAAKQSAAPDVTTLNAQSGTFIVDEDGRPGFQVYEFNPKHPSGKLCIAVRDKVGSAIDCIPGKPLTTTGRSQGLLSFTGIIKDTETLRNPKAPDLEVYTYWPDAAPGSVCTITRDTKAVSIKCLPESPKTPAP